MSVDLHIKGKVARVTINRPERMNAIDSTTATALENIWQEIEQDSSLRCVVLTGSGDKAFSAGADMKSETETSGLAYWVAANPNGFGGISLRQSLTIPVIARVAGVALGGGMEMVLGCDIVIASERARFALPEARVGRLPLDGGMVHLQRRIPRNIAAGLMLTGRMLSAAEAYHYGLVNEMAPPELLDDAVERWVSDIVSCAPLSCAAIKQTLQKTAHLTPVEARNFSHPALIRALQSEDADEGVLAFREKRAPQWRGK